MTDNGTVKEIIKVTLEGGKMDVKLNAKLNTALLSHAIRLCSLELDNMIIVDEQKKVVQTIVPKSVMDKLRGKR